ncbi:MAG: HisA/HisF-related TIM barrel protein [Candidatus Caldarchaeum sp.]|nr:HisA/HisF-related TIM barrel protein [Candidatus Caldarchaeum sp.]MDW8435592.1 HisA/HisF-related TIM barrel protein [Candidatus Caldarchaeum sp.]
MFQVYAAVDVLDGRVARLVRGRREDAVFYGGSPVDFVRRWRGEGADWVHLVDLNAALGLGDNEALVSDVVRAVGVRVQVGGGVRDLAKAERLIRAGAERVVVGSIYYRSRDEALKILRVLGDEHVAVAVDFGQDANVLVHGWREQTSLSLVDAVENVLADGFKHVLATDVFRDGTLAGVNPAVLASVPPGFRKSVVVGGGVASVSDVLKIREMGFAGVVLGKALYEGRVNLPEVRAVMVNSGV